MRSSMFELGDADREEGYRLSSPDATAFSAELS